MSYSRLKNYTFKNETTNAKCPGLLRVMARAGRLSCARGRGVMFCLSKRATFILEYVILIAVIMAALCAMQVYLKRTISGRFRGTADAFGQGRQYEPGVTTITDN